MIARRASTMRKRGQLTRCPSFYLRLSTQRAILKPLCDRCHRKPSTQRFTAALSAPVTYIIPIIISPMSAGLSVSGCVLR